MRLSVILVRATGDERGGLWYEPWAALPAMKVAGTQGVIAAALIFQI